MATTSLGMAGSAAMAGTSGSRTSGVAGLGLVVAACAAALLLAGWTVRAEPATGSIEQATQHHERGIELFNQGDFEGAAAEFVTAEQIAHSPANLFNLARCYERLGRVREAIEAVDRFLALELPADRRASALELRNRLAATPGQVEVTSAPAGAEVWVDGQVAPGAVTPATLPLPPGEHTVEARLAGHVGTSQQVTVEPAGVHRLAFSLAPQAVGGGGTGEPGPAGPRRRRLRWTVAFEVTLGLQFDLQRDLADAFVPTFGVVGGLDLDSVRLEASALVSVQALFDKDVLIEFGGGGRLGVRLARLPLRIEGEALVMGSYYDQDLGLDFSMSLGIAWQARRWLEVVGRPARLTFVNMTESISQEDDTMPMLLRYGFDVGVRFRL